MRILLTNDDGINAPGLKVLEEIAAQVAGPDGEVWVVAPAFEQSGVGHCISYTHPTMLAELEPHRWAAEGSPADCVLAAVGDIMGKGRPDLILSGVNRGNNAGENVVYSGTIGAAMEGALHGIPSIALSQYSGPRTAELTDPFEAARTHGVRVVQSILDYGHWGADDDYKIFYNVNFPPVAAADVAGLRVCPQGRRYDADFGVLPHLSPSGRRFVWIQGGAQHVAATPDSDVDVLHHGMISVTPLRADLTCRASMDGLRAALEG